MDVFAPNAPRRSFPEMIPFCRIRQSMIPSQLAAAAQPRARLVVKLDLDTTRPNMEGASSEPLCDLPTLVVTECQDLLAQIAEKTERIKAKDKLIKELAKESDVARRLQTMPGVGPMTALAVEAFAPDMAQFSCGRDFAAWLGLVPLQSSTGGKVAA